MTTSDDIEFIKDLLIKLDVTIDSERNKASIEGLMLIFGFTEEARKQDIIKALDILNELKENNKPKFKVGDKTIYRGNYGQHFNEVVEITKVNDGDFEYGVKFKNGEPWNCDEEHLVSCEGAENENKNNN